MKEKPTSSLTSDLWLEFFRMQLRNPPLYDFSRKSFVPKFSKSCFFPPMSLDFELGLWDVTRLYFDQKLACLERIFICIAIVAIVLGSIISLWTQLDNEFKNFHKPAPNGHDYQMVPSNNVKTKNKKCQTLRTTNATNEFLQ